MAPYLYNPQNPEELLRFYFVWMVVLMLIHLVWDWWHPNTPRLKLANLKHKITELYSSATVASSVLMGSVLWNGFRTHPLFSSDAIYVPLVMSTIVGFMVGLSGLAPSEPNPSS